MRLPSHTYTSHFVGRHSRMRRGRNSAAHSPPGSRTLRYAMPSLPAARARLPSDCAAL
jgi:hypothetical protein